MSSLDRTGEKFNLDLFLSARAACIEATSRIINRVEVGMGEPDIKTLVKDEFKMAGVKKFWHPSKIRIGADTIKNFRAPSDPDLVCQKGDLCSLDFGPVIQDHEADFGRTFVVGSKKKSKLVEASHDIFDRTSAKWKNENLNGADLFEFAAAEAEKLGFILNRHMAGHRVGDFPHKIYSASGALFSYKSVPSKNLWVLEIHLLDPKNQRGAFFEDILM